MSDDTQETETDAEVQADENTTTSAAVRWEHLSTFVTIVVTSAYTGMVLAEKVGLPTETLPGGTWATFNLAFLAVLIYSVGIDSVKAASELRSGNGGGA